MSDRSIPLDPHARADDGHDDAEHLHEIAPDLAYRRLAIVNVVLVGAPDAGDRGWVLVDSGIPGSAGRIEAAAASRFGATARPAAIVMTHGHSDHVGAVEELAARWDAPVYAHSLERPYLTGEAGYPPADPMVGGGLMAYSSPTLPRGPVDVSNRLRLVEDGAEIPELPGWSVVHSPGHTVGHLSLWRERDRTLVVGDAFVTTDQESVYAVATQKPAMHGPPQYFTGDWDAARESVRRLAALEPELVVTGHGRAMRGPIMLAALRRLAEEFDAVARPRHGRNVRKPQRAEDGTAYDEA